MHHTGPLIACQVAHGRWVSGGTVAFGYPDASTGATRHPWAMFEHLAGSTTLTFTPRTAKTDGRTAEGPPARSGPCLIAGHTPTPRLKLEMGSESNQNRTKPTIERHVSQTTLT